MAGANAIFTGDAMLTTPCSPWDEVKKKNINAHCLMSLHIPKDKAMMERWGLSGMRSFEQPGVKQKEADRLGVEKEMQPSL